MESLLASLMQMSIYGSIAIIIVLLARIPMKRMPKGFSYALWSAPLLRLCIPLSVPGFFSFMPQRDQVISVTNPSMQFMDPIVMGLPVASESGIRLDTVPIPLTASVTLAEMFFAAWLIGVTCFMAYGVYSWIRLSKRLQTAEKIQDGVYISRKIDTPFVMGVLHPAIYLPESLNQAEKPYILMHEEYHIKRKDPLIKLISFLVLAIHWFNPFVWVAFFASSQDMEMSCDEAVLRKCGGDIKQVIQSYEEVDNLSYDIVDSKITSLDQIASFDSILNQPNSSRDPMGWHNLIFPLEKKHNFCFRSQPKRERTESGVWKAGWMEMERSITTIRKLIKD
jgi:beta-lactamase regulating signal transducer with metallopeptidase domain